MTERKIVSVAGNKEGRNERTKKGLMKEMKEYRKEKNKKKEAERRKERTQRVLLKCGRQRNKAMRNRSPREEKKE